MTDLIPTTVEGQGFVPSARKWIFYFISSYLFFICNSYQFPTQIAFTWLWDILVPIFASVFEPEGIVHTTRTGSGDTIFNFYQSGMFLVLAAFIASILSVTLKKEKHFHTFKRGVFMLVRYYVIAQMLIYGLSKVFYLQFRYPSDIAMEKRLGDMSPMGLLWTFMGYSKGYTMFTGWLEVLGGVLLLFRRTTVLGALVTLGVMSNVLMLNLCYDVPVKLLSFHIVVMAIFLILPVWKEVFQFFLSREEVSRGSYPFFDYKDSWKVMLGFKLGAFVLGIVAVIGFMAKNGAFDKVVPGYFDGKYDVSGYQLFMDGEESKFTNSSTDWESLNFHNGKYAAIKSKEEGSKAVWYNIKEDSLAHTFSLTRFRDSIVNEFVFTELDNGLFEVKGNWQGDSLSFNMRKSEEVFLLKSRKFHWVQEQAFNR